MTNASINVIPVPAFQDNYLWLFHRSGDTRSYVVDPGAAEPVEKALAEHGLDLSGILVTHHHLDHTGGIDDLLKRWKVPVYGPAAGSVPQVTQPVREGDKVLLDNGLEFQVLEVPGHTLDHLAYFCDADSQPLLFCGDTLFAGGCGRLFEGSAEQMQKSLTKLRELPDNTLVYCAHEYTLSNLDFAAAVDAENSQLQDRINVERKKREQNQPTVPSTIGLEKSTNPFLRWDNPAIIAAAQSHTGSTLNTGHDVLAAIRAWKDNF